MADNTDRTGHQARRPALVIATFERPKGLVTALKSGLAALPSGAELIVVDDGTIHSAQLTLTSFDDPRIRIAKTQGRQGPSAARNLGVNLAQADVIFFLDDDDALVPDYVTRVLDVLSFKGKNCDFGFSAMIQGASVSRRSIPTGPMQDDSDLGERLAGLGMGFWITKSKFLSVGGLDENIRINEDTEFCLRLADRNALGWYEATPGVEINPGIAASMPNDQPSLTKASNRLERAQVFEYLLEEYAELLANNKNLRRRFALRTLKYTSQTMGVRAALKKARQLLPQENLGLLIAQLLVWRGVSFVKGRKTGELLDVK